ncbi:MAG: cupin domain-containing protein [Myxococcota bacterium]
MLDTTISKIDSRFSPKGSMGQRYLASGVRVALRLWDGEPPETQDAEYTQRDYEVVGYVLKGRARLQIENQTVLLAPGDSWVVPEGARHRYEILETFSAVEATAPPAHVHARDEPNVASAGPSANK